MIALGDQKSGLSVKETERNFYKPLSIKSNFYKEMLGIKPRSVIRNSKNTRSNYPPLEGGSSIVAIRGGVNKLKLFIVLTPPRFTSFTWDLLSLIPLFAKNAFAFFNAQSHQGEDNGTEALGHL